MCTCEQAIILRVMLKEIRLYMFKERRGDIHTTANRVGVPLPVRMLA